MAFPSTPQNNSDLDDDVNAGGLVARDAAGDNAPALSITEISAVLKRTVEQQFGHVRVRGELSGVKRAASGHLYLSLKDEAARLDGVMWRGSVQRLGFLPEDGVEVIATGKLTTYPGRSNYQIVIDRMEIAGEGALLALLEKTKARLAAEGLFDAERKRPLPYLPGVIGVVTSPTGAVIRDILHRLRDRFPSHVVIWPVLVQGQGAAAQIAAAVRGFSALAPGGLVARPDLVIVARGGGSIEDLWCFNEEEVVRAIAASTIPVISAVGHETDTTLADFAADMRAPTPTAAAEMAVPVRGELAATLADLNARQRRSAVRMLDQARERLIQRAERLPPPLNLLQGQTQRLDDLGDRLRRALMHRTELAGAALSRHGSALRPALLEARLRRAREMLAAQRVRPEALAQRIAALHSRIDALDRLRRSLDPRAPLQRGYVLVSGLNGQLVRSRAAAAVLGSMMLEFGDGTLAVAPISSAPISSTPITSAPVGSALAKAPQQAAAPARTMPKSRASAPDATQPKLL